MGILFSFNQNNDSSKHGSSIDTLSDDEIYDLIEEATRPNTGNALGDPHFTSVWRITRDAVAKATRGTPAEPFMMSYVSSHTSIRMPQVRRVLPRYRPSKGQQITGVCQQWIIMDYVEGDTLKVAWPSMSWWGRLRVIWYMRSYVRQLHKVPVLYPDVPGPFDTSGAAHDCNAYFFANTGGGPFHSYNELADWFDRRRFHALVIHHRRMGRLFSTKDWPKFDRSYPLTLCHMDLHMQNIIVGRDGKPWLIDWGSAGAFPAWLEYAVLKAWVLAPKFWLRSVGFMTGNHGKYVNDYIFRMLFLFEECAKDAPPDYFTKLGLDVD